MDISLQLLPIIDLRIHSTEDLVSALFFEIFWLIRVQEYSHFMSAVFAYFPRIFSFTGEY
jgi:hypothetical protein